MALVWQHVAQWSLISPWSSGWPFDAAAHSPSPSQRAIVRLRIGWKRAQGDPRPQGPFTFAYQNPQACTTYSEVRPCTETAGNTLTPLQFITQKQRQISQKPACFHRASFVSASLTNFDAQNSRVRRIRKSPTCLHPNNNLHELLHPLDHDSTVCAGSLRL